MLERVWLQLVLLAVAGGVCAFGYLALLRSTVFGKSSSRLSLLGAIGVFILATAGALGVVWLVASGSPENLLIVFGGFVIVRALFGSAMCGSCEIDALEQASEAAPDQAPGLNSDMHWGAIAAEDVGSEGVEHGRGAGPEPFREYSPVH